MNVQTGLISQLVAECSEASREASEARESDWAALVGCLANPQDDSLAHIQKQAEDFLALSERLTDWHTRLVDEAQPLSMAERQRLLADLRLALTAIRIAAFDVGLHGRSSRMTDSEIADELGKYARLDYQLRARILPPLKEELGVSDTVAI